MSTSGQRPPPRRRGDLAIVNYALTLEYLESEFYTKVIASGLFKGAVLSTIKTFGAEEDEHVVALKGVAMKLGKPAPKPTGKFPVKSATQVATLAATVENLGAAAYLGQAPLIQSKEILAAALSIHTHRGASRRDAQPAHQEDPDPERRVRRAGDHAAGAGRRQAVHRVSGERSERNMTMTDTDLSNPELAEVEVHGMNRASFLLKGALATGAVYGASAVAPFVSSALAALE